MVLPVTVKSPITVEEALEIKPVVERRPEEFTENKVEAAAFRNFKKLPPNEVVEEATIKSPVVLVALTWR